MYCLLRRDGRRPSALGRPPRGLPGARPPRLLEAGDGLWLVVADAPLDRYGSQPIERRLGDLEWVSTCALGHERVIEHAAGLGAVVPMKLFTLFDSDERALDHIRRRRRTLDRLFARIAGRQEWGIRLLLDPARALGPAGSGDGARRPAASGTAFLLRKKQEQDAVRRVVERARHEADRIYEALARRADDARRHTPPQGGTPLRLLLDAAFLVRVSQAARFRATVAAEARRLDSRGFRLTLTGPWPPYTFVTGPA